LLGYFGSYAVGSFGILCCEDSLGSCMTYASIALQSCR